MYIVVERLELTKVLWECNATMFEILDVLIIGIMILNTLLHAVQILLNQRNKISK